MLFRPGSIDQRISKQDSESDQAFDAIFSCMPISRTTTIMTSLIEGIFIFNYLHV